jgi:hypothetical protein
MTRAGVPFLLLTGPEPDLLWRRFTAAVQEIIDRLGVRLTVGLNAIPMAVPHTRPTGITAHATRRELITGYEPWLQRVLVPGSAGHLLEYELGRNGRDAIGFAVHVPHYLSQTDYPAAAELVLNSVSKATGLLLPTEGLHAAAEQLRGDIYERIKGDSDDVALVTALEQQYDAYLRGRESTNLLTTPRSAADRRGEPAPSSSASWLSNPAPTTPPPAASPNPTLMYLSSARGLDVPGRSARSSAAGGIPPSGSTPEKVRSSRSGVAVVGGEFEG